MKAAASVFHIPMAGHANGNSVTFRESSIEVADTDPGVRPRAWSLETLSSVACAAPKPLRKKGFFGTTSSIESSWQVLAAQTLKIASINGLGRLDKLEHELEDEINYENRSPAKTKFGRFKQVGAHQLHSKFMLLVIVLLNIIDTLLVMTGMILDFHHVSLSLGAKSEMLSSFTEDLDHKYHMGKNESHVLQILLNSHIIFNISSLRDNTTDIASDCAGFLNETALKNNQDIKQYMAWLLQNYSSSHGSNVCFQPHYSNETSSLANTGEVDDTLSTVAHKLHYCSISILSLLVIILILKLICFGKRFFKERMLVFDGLITIISFVLDIVFMNGVTFFTEEQFVIILTLLFPWRVIRILNSLIAAVLDKQRLNLKILYTQKKKISRTLTETNSKIEVMQRHIEVLQNLCSSRGIGDMEVRRALTGDSSSSQKNGASGGLASMMALGKLAYQAADALAPMSNGYKKPKSASSSPALSSLGNSPYNSPTKSMDSNDNNNAILKNQNESADKERQTEIPKLSESSSDSPSRSPLDSENVTIHMNGSGPPLEDDETDRAIHTSVVLPDQAEDTDASERHQDSRL